MYPVDLHMHTIASTHAYNTLRDCRQQAQTCGIKLLAITDRGAEMADVQHDWHFVNMHGNSKAILGLHEDGIIFAKTSTASVFHITLDRVSTNFIFPPYGGEAAFRQITLLVLQDVFGDRAINWPSNVKCSQHRKPQLPLETNTMDVLKLASYEDGNTWSGFFNG